MRSLCDAGKFTLVTQHVTKEISRLKETIKVMSLLILGESCHYTFLCVCNFAVASSTLLKTFSVKLLRSDHKLDTESSCYIQSRKFSTVVFAQSRLVMSFVCSIQKKAINGELMQIITT
jgi:hypothetical protein